MEQITSVWNALDARRKIIVGMATVAVFAAVLGLARMAAAPNMALLYAGLEPVAAGEVVGALEAQNVAYDVQAGGIYVDARRRDELRLTLAAEGLPANSSRGYELLDDLTGFGTTAQMFDAAYWRAKEGELSRTIMSSPHVSAARVHIGVPAAQGLRPRNAPSASVTVTTADGTLTPAHAKALKYLVSSAVPGLSPDDVPVIDSRGGLIQTGEEAVAQGDAGNRTDALKRNVQRLLEARVGFGNAVVELSIDTAQENETIRERTFDPDSRVAISSEISETTNAATESGDGGVTVASNLPSGAGAVGSTSNSNTSEVRERVNYEVSETTREVTRGPGTVRRITAAVLVDGIRTVGADGVETWAPRSDAELAALRDLVANAIGFDESRGDALTLQTMEFEPVAQLGTEAVPGLLTRFGIDTMSLLKVALLALVTLILGLFVLRPALISRPVNAEALPPPAPTAEPPRIDLPALTGEIEEGAFEHSDLALVSDGSYPGGREDRPALGSEIDPVERLRKLIEDRQSETVEILRGWMEDDAEEPV